MENLFLPKVFYVTKSCPKKLARAKKIMRAQKRKKSIFGAINFAPPPQLFESGVLIPNQACGIAQNSLKRDLLEYCIFKHDMHTYGTLRAGFVDFSPQKFSCHLSDLLKYASLLCLRSMS